jgi:hypothetical protein
MIEDRRIGAGDNSLATKRQRDLHVQVADPNVRAL